VAIVLTVVAFQRFVAARRFARPQRFSDYRAFLYKIS